MNLGWRFSALQDHGVKKSSFTCSSHVSAVSVSSFFIKETFSLMPSKNYQIPLSVLSSILITKSTTTKELKVQSIALNEASDVEELFKSTSKLSH